MNSDRKLTKKYLLCIAFLTVLPSVKASALVGRPAMSVPKGTLVREVVHNGSPVKKGGSSWRFTVKLLGNGLCTGAVISDKHILAAAHCAGHVDKVQFYFGSSSMVSERSIVNTLVHPSYRENIKGRNDVAIFEFAGGLPNGEYTPVKILADKNPQIGEVYIAGYGKTTSDRYSVLTFGKGEFILNDEEAFGYDDGTNTYPCPGDSGSPAFVLNKDGPILIGVASIGWGACDNNGGGGYYMYAPYFYPWIQSILHPT